MNERLKMLREKLQITQEEFGKRIGSARNTIANYEIGKRIPSNTVILAICKEFNINESWLRTGEGGNENMFTQNFLEDEYMIYATEIGNGGNEIIKNAIIKYGRLSPKNKQIIDQALDILLNNTKEG